ncbi:flavodoxin [bacterium]|nr:flavodoxin [bacterium]
MITELDPKPMSRRAFLKTAGIVLGGAVVIGTGCSVNSDAPQSEISMPNSTFGEDKMSKRILVTFASQGGSTAGVAEAIAKALADAGCSVDLKPVKEVADLTPYKGVVVGSAVHSGKWMPEATNFVERNKTLLRRMPTAIFQVCMMMASSNVQYKAMVPGWLNPLKDELKPVAAGSFAGALLLDQYPKFSDRLGLRIFLASVKLKEGDYRDWDAIRSWAEDLRPSMLS